jgi:hypothetical protein
VPGSDRIRSLVAIALRPTAWRSWPWAVFFGPIILYVLYAIVRDGFRVSVLSANPALRENGRSTGSKRLVYDLLDGHFECLPRYQFVPAELRFDHKCALLEAFAGTPEGGYPLVLKPDKSERGHGVVVASDAAQARHYLQHAPYSVVLQEFIEGDDFGMLLVGHPGNPALAQLYLCRRAAISVNGDGSSALRDLIWRDRTLRPIYDTLCRDMAASLADVPAAGETVRLTRSVAISRDQRNVVFSDLTGAISDRLATEVHKIRGRLGGYYAGRFDLRAGNLDDLANGRFRLLEANDVLSEPIHMFDARHGLLDTYRAYFAYYRHATDVGRHNVRTGTNDAVTLAAAWRLFRSIRRRRKAELAFEAVLADFIRQRNFHRSAP